MIYSEKAKRQALIVDNEGNAKRLPRIPFAEGSFNEAWLQKLIEDNPVIIPTHDINGCYSSLVCIGREVPVGNGKNQGFIDNLYVTPQGQIVIVETKLFRNQESRRTVIAQIIDYAKELHTWDCEKLDIVTAKYTLNKFGQSSRMIDLMMSKGYLSSSDESEFTDSVNRCLNDSSFLLMIIGDGIRSGVEQIVDFLNENSNMSFSLALAELEIYQNGNDTIVIPYLLTNTSVIERYVYTEQGLKRESSEHPIKPLMSKNEFIKQFAVNGKYDSNTLSGFIDEINSINGLSIGIAPTEMTIRFNVDEASFPLMTFSISQCHADLWVCPVRIRDFLDKHGIFRFEADCFLDSYKQYIDETRCKSKPYENESGFYFAKVADILSNPNPLISAAEKFCRSITSNE